MKRIKWTSPGLLATLFLGMGIANSIAEDIDLFTGVSPNLDPPSLLLVWHSTANSSASISPAEPCVYNDPSDPSNPLNGTPPSLGNGTVAGMEQCAMVNTMLSLKNQAALLGNIKVGLMMFNQNAFSNFDNGTDDPSTTNVDESLGNGDGRCGFLVSPPAIMDVAGINAFVGRIVALDNADLANQSRLGDTVAEAWAMLNGLSTSCSGVNYSTLADVATACRNAVMVYIGNATKENSSVADGIGSSTLGSAEDILKGELTNGFGYTTSSDEYLFFSEPMAVTSLNNSGSANNSFWGDELSQFMRNINPDDRLDGQQPVRNISTYSIAVYDPAIKDKLAGQINFYANMAVKGGGKSFLVDSQNHASLQEVLIQIFNEAQAINSVFASATLPVSANTQGTFLNQVYIAMFRPDESSKPRWYGNLKQYQLGFDAGGNIVLTDSTFDPANEEVESVTNPLTGTVISDAISFWTTNNPSPGVTGWPEGGANGTPDGFWRNSPSGDGFRKDLPDGDLVEKGGAAQMLRVDNLTATYADDASNNARKLYTCNTIGGCPAGTALPEFNTGNTSLDTSLFTGVSASSSLAGVTMTAGRNFGATINFCQKQGNNRFCDVTYTGPDIPIANGDRIDSNAADDRCSASSPCLVRDVVKNPAEGTITFEYEFASGEAPTLSNVPATFYLGSNTITATGTGHGLTNEDTSVLSDCVNTNDANDADGAALVFGADDKGGLPNSPFSREIGINNVVGDTFQFELNPSVFAGSARNISCTITTGVDIPTLIRWVRGEDNAGNEIDPGPCDGVDCSPAITIRPSVHGDVLHSRPAVINYGDGIGAVVFYGSNDGVFHAINGNQTSSISGTRPGGELWGFIPPEFFSKLTRLYQNSPPVDIANSIDPTAEKRDYFFDGTTTILQDNRPAGVSTTAGKRFIFMSARRGGPYIYALDVTDPTTPKYLWSIIGGPGGDIPELGDTWSQPRVAVVKGHANPVVIFGAGYDNVEDVEPYDVNDDPQPTYPDTTLDSGRGIIVVDAVDGSLVWAALADCSPFTASDNCVATAGTTDADGDVRLSHNLTDPIAADVTLFDNDFDGLIDRIYAADTGGNIWRVDLQPEGVGGNTAPTNWVMTKFASIAGAGNDARKFLFAPDVVPTKNFDIVVAVTGDREKPLFDTSTVAGRGYNVNNRFYVFLDTNGGDSVPANNPVITEANLVDRTGTQCIGNSDNDGDGLVACSYDEPTDTYKDAAGNVVPLTTITTLNANAFKGYYMTLEGSIDGDGDSEGEKGINAPLVVAGKAFFGTNQPDIPAEGSCTANLGIARGYKLDLFTGKKTVNVFAGGGLPPSPIAGLVTIGDETVPFLIGGEGPSAFDPSTPELDLSGGRKRSYWYYK